MRVFRFVYIDGTHGEIYPELVDIQANDGDLPINQDAVNYLKEFEAYAKHPIKHIFVVRYGRSQR